MKSLIHRWLPAATLGIWAGVLLGAFFTGRVKDLLHPMFHIPVLVSGVALLFLAMLAGGRSLEECCDDDACSHSTTKSTAGRLLTFLILIVPVAASALFSPEGYSRTTIENRGIITDAAALGKTNRPAPPRPPETRVYEPPLPNASGIPSPEQVNPADYIPRTESGHYKVEVVDLLYAAQDPTLRADFENKVVEVTGQIMPATSSNPKGDRFKVVRMLMVCCAADARPVAALVESPTKPEIAEMSWVKIVGTATFTIESGRTLTVIKATSVSTTEPPDASMLY